VDVAGKHSIILRACTWFRLGWIPGHGLPGHDQASGELPAAAAGTASLRVCGGSVPCLGRRFESVMVATIAAGMWSLMTGTVVVMAVAVLRS
jgi:hypothetical protein